MSNKITQAELERFRDVKKKLKAKQESIKQAEAIVSDMEKVLVDRLRAGDGFESGLLMGKVAITTRRTVKWKDVVEELKGRAFVEKTIASTPESETEHFEVFERMG